MSKISSNLSRRNKSLKQLVQGEREAAMRAAGAKFKERKRKEALPAKSRLVGAALQAVARREERERRAKEAAGADEGKEEVIEAEMKDEDAQEKAVAEEGEDKIVENEDGAPKRDIPTYSSVEAPPSLRPAKKYCDVTGLIAPYTDPKSGLRYHSVEVYEIIKQFGPGVDNAYKSLRGDGSQI
ncbi:potential vacuolar protein sorting protein [Pseudozyma hubeiensis SY62]|uniref:Potential vacuolar protein sorting protein n=1 Tax=Pseudozyma hubeiensis (strain SY62) TaxID=1305764 RepID=R9NX54_PSEHS|nr:potential vacuolar protein sorting protein [Pseudozyma hubeiensis SY62]GAC93228.1 potential vacuolar protein sorting protein [Pseudozyma hubeiensis SY62]